MWRCSYEHLSLWNYLYNVYIFSNCGDEKGEHSEILLANMIFQLAISFSTLQKNSYMEYTEILSLLICQKEYDHLPKIVLPQWPYHLSPLHEPTAERLCILSERSVFSSFFLVSCVLIHKINTPVQPYSRAWYFSWCRSNWDTSNLLLLLFQ